MANTSKQATGVMVSPYANPWGRQSSLIELQRSDLWRVDFSTIVEWFWKMGLLTSYPAIVGVDLAYFPISVTIPELKVNSEVVRRDSKPCHMPSWDEAPGPLTMVFRLDTDLRYSTANGNDSASSSVIVQFLHAWRALVRTGRGSMSVEPQFLAAANYQVPYAHDFSIELLRGKVTKTSPPSPADLTLEPTLEVATCYQVKKAWLSTVTQSIFSYDGKDLATVTAVFNCQDVKPKQDVDQKDPYQLVWPTGF